MDRMLIFFADTVYAFVTAISLTIDTPNGAEIWTVGDTRTIGWTTVGSVPLVDLHYSTDSGASFSVISLSLSNTGSYAWNIPNTISRYARVRVQNSANTATSDSSNSNFTIAGGFYLTAPNGAEAWTVGSAQNITWTSTGTISNV